VLLRELKGLFLFRGHTVADEGGGILKIYVKVQRAEMQTTTTVGFFVEGPEIVGSELTQPVLSS
jgi:hypothetical protein